MDGDAISRLGDRKNTPPLRTPSQVLDHEAL
jgi:hypothetical protein